MNTKFKIGLLLAGLVPFAAVAQFSLMSLNEAVVIDFDTTVAGVNNGQFTGSGFQPNPEAGQLDSDAWAFIGMSDGSVGFGDTQTSGDVARGTASSTVTTGGLYAVGSEDRQLMIQPGGDDWTPGTLTLRIVNNTGAAFSAIAVSYDLFVRNDQGRSNSFNFSYSLDDSAYTNVLGVGFQYVSPEASDDYGWINTASPAITLSFTASILNGDSFYIRWTGDDIGGNGSRDEFGLDNISITAVPEPSAYATAMGVLALMGVVHQRRRRRR